MRASRATGRRTPRQEHGAQAEDRAADFLAARGLAIVARNFRSRFGEIDLIARDGDTLVFVEVRRRSGAHFGGAAASVDAPKRRRLEAAARHYLSRLGEEPACRFDVIVEQGAEMAWLQAAFETR